MNAAICFMEADPGLKVPKLILTPMERALLRQLVTGHSLEDASSSLGLTPSETHSALQRLQAQCGVSSMTRLIVLAILNAWV